MSRLSLRYEYDESFFDKRLDRDDFGRLTVSVAAERFSGQGGFWVQWQEVREFGEALSAFPIESDKPLKARWGYDQLEGDDLILSIEIAPANRTGDLVVRVEIGDDLERWARVRTSFLTNYPDLEAFRLAIGELMDRKIDEAVLGGH